MTRTAVLLVVLVLGVRGIVGGGDGTGTVAPQPTRTATAVSAAPQPTRRRSAGRSRPCRAHQAAAIATSARGMFKKNCQRQSR